jgi:hypothetical protein
MRTALVGKLAYTFLEKKEAVNGIALFFIEGNCRE